MTKRLSQARGRPMTVAMKSTMLTWEQTLPALLPLVGERVWATTLVNEAPVSGFAERLRRVGVEPAAFTSVEEAQLDFGEFAGLVFLRRDEHLVTHVLEDGTLRVEMIRWVLELEPS